MLVLKCQGSRSPGLLHFSRSALGSGVPVHLSPFRGCLSGSSEHGSGAGGGGGGGSVSSSGHPAGVFSADCTLKSWPWPGLGVFGYSMFGFSVALLPGASAVSFAFVMVTLCFGTSLAPRLAGFTVPARSTRDKIAWETVITCGYGQVFLVRLGRRIVGSACRSCLPQVVACRWGRRSQSPSGSGCLGTGVLALGHEPVGFVSLGPVALVLSLRVFFVKNLLSSWYLGVGVALALTLARLLLCV